MISNNSLSTNPNNFDHRDIIIQRLQQEVEELHKNEQDYSDLNFLLTNLEHRYNLLNEEKIRNENDFINRQDEHLKTIADLQCALDDCKNALTQKDQEIEEAYIQISGLKDLDKHKDQDLEQIKQELFDLSTAYNNLKEDNIYLESHAKKMEDEKKFIEKELEKLHKLVDETYEKHTLLSQENKSLQDKIINLSQENELLKGEVSKKSNEINEIQRKIQQQINETKNIEASYQKHLEQQMQDFKNYEQRLLEENERKEIKLLEEFDSHKADFEEKTLEIANNNKDMLKQLEQVFEKEENIRQKIEIRQRNQEQTKLQEKSLQIALKELQEELLLSRTTPQQMTIFSSNKNYEHLKNSLNKRLKNPKLNE